MTVLKTLHAHLLAFQQRDAFLFNNLPLDARRGALSYTMMFFDVKKDVQFRRIDPIMKGSAHELMAINAYEKHWYDDGRILDDAMHAVLSSLAKIQGLGRSEMTLARDSRGQFSLSFYMSKFIDINDKVKTETFNWKGDDWLDEMERSLDILISNPLKGKTLFHVALADEWIVPIFSDSYENAALKAVLCFHHLRNRPDGFSIQGCSSTGAQLLEQAFARLGF